MAEKAHFGGVELGGTKTLAAIGHDDGTVLIRETFSTGRPQDLLPMVAQFFSQQSTDLGPLAGIGVGAFGPIEINRSSPGYGRLLETNKPGWSGFDLVGALQSACHVPVALITDVAAAGVGEARLGALGGLELGVYLTVGTGIGGAIIYRGAPLPALLHPEMGHIALQRRSDDTAPSTCRFHASCAEGLAAGPAIMERFGKSLSDSLIADDQRALIADYLGQLCATLVLALSPQRIVLGGGVSKAPGLISAVHSAMLDHLGGYGARAVEASGFLCVPELDQDAGIVGALCWASQAEL
ncbi:MAG: ROK family protein [Pseudomonadota bacterium]|nr:ROK family protein [Pseudomonadota bacterium]